MRICFSQIFASFSVSAHGLSHKLFSSAGQVPPKENKNGNGNFWKSNWELWVVFNGYWMTAVVLCVYEHCQFGWGQCLCDCLLLMHLWVKNSEEFPFYTSWHMCLIANWCEVPQQYQVTESWSTFIPAWFCSSGTLGCILRGSPGALFQ